MTHGERLLAPFKGIVPDQPAWLADLGYWYRAMEKMGKLEERYQEAEGYLRLHEDMGVCAYYGQGASTFRALSDAVEAGTEDEADGQGKDEILELSPYET